jgi:DNA-binding CsgD family transcriptional regulator
VYTYRSRIMSKLESSTVAALVRFAIRHRLIKP